MLLPPPKKIAPQALEDSYIPTIEQSVIQAVVQSSGWNLLSDALAKLDKAAKGIEDTLNTQISGWEMEIKTFKQKVEEYRRRADSAKSKVKAVRESIEEQKQTLIRGFSQGINAFAEGAKTKINDEIERIAEYRSSKNPKTKTQQRSVEVTRKNIPGNFITFFMDLGADLLELIPVLGKTLAKSFKTASPLINALCKGILS